MDRLAKSKVNIIRRHFIGDKLSGAKIAAELGIQRDTVYKYLKEFETIERLYPHKLKDFTFALPKPPRFKTFTYDEFINVLPELVDTATTLTLEVLSLWKIYRTRYPKGYSLYWFSKHYNVWRKAQNLCKYYHRRIRVINVADVEELTHWRNSRDIKLWQKAVVILDSIKGRTVLEVSAQIEVSTETILIWIKRYQNLGIEGLCHKTFTPDPKKVASSKHKQENILKLLQQSPRLHNVNRTAWRLTDLSNVYERVYLQPLGPHAIGEHLRKMGYHFQKSRERLASPDKQFHEKMDAIKRILAQLQPDEKFFSIDEYGPAIVNMKVGWSLTKDGEVKTVPQLQKKKGWYIMTAALELSTNQVTHFYSPRKDSTEMIKLIEVLSQQYKGNTTLYLSWDCASWHCSKMLIERIHVINTLAYRQTHGTPCIVLAPLPSSAQYLNIIESVFSGMAKSVIHNSDYASVDECQVAIDRYFAERNQYFQLNPQKAGKKIWGNEVVKAVFQETNSCKTKKKIVRKK